MECLILGITNDFVLVYAVRYGARADKLLSTRIRDLQTEYQEKRYALPENGEKLVQYAFGKNHFTLHAVYE